MVKLDIDGLDGSLVVPASALNSADSGAVNQSKDTDKSSLSEPKDSHPFSTTEPLDEEGNGFENNTINQSAVRPSHTQSYTVYDDDFFNEVTQPVRTKDAEGEAISSELLLKRLSAAAKEDKKLSAQTVDSEGSAEQNVIPTLRDRVSPGLTPESNSASPHDQADRGISKVFIALAVFALGIFIGAASLLTWFDADEELFSAEYIDKIAGLVLPQETDLQSTETSESISSLVPSAPTEMEPALPSSEEQVPESHRQTGAIRGMEPVITSSEEQEFAKFQPEVEGDATHQSSSQAQQQIALDRRTFEQDTSTPKSELETAQYQNSVEEKITSNDSIMANERSVSAQQVSDEIPEKDLLPVQDVHSMSWTIPFSFNDLKARRDAVRNITDHLMKCDEGLIITGHTCSLGKADQNYYVGLARAKSVRKVLTELGIPGNQIKVASAGDTQPANTNATDEGRRANRRVVISCLSE